MNETNPLEVEPLTWAVLLARWVDFARSAVALPVEGQPGLLKQSVTDVITLQAVWFALRQMDELGAPERAIGLDRAGVLIERHIQAIQGRFGDSDLPEDLDDLIVDVKGAYEQLKQTP